MEGDKAAIHTRLIEYQDALNDHDLDRAAHIACEDNQLMVPHEEDYHGRNGIREFNEGWKKVEYSDVSDIEVLTDTYAITRIGFYTILKNRKSGPFRALMVWKKIDGTWFVYRSCFNGEPQ